MTENEFALERVNEQLIFQLNFKANNTYPIVPNTIDYFNDYGFKNAIKHSNKITFNRGSFLLNPYLSNPIKWKSQININFEDNQINAVFVIHTAGQFVTNKEIELWETFITNYKKYMTQKFDHKSDFNKSKRKTLFNSLKLVIFIILLIFLILIPLGFVAYKTNWSWIMYLAAPLSLGTFSYFYKRK